MMKVVIFVFNTKVNKNLKMLITFIIRLETIHVNRPK